MFQYKLYKRILIVLIIVLSSINYSRAQDNPAEKIIRQIDSLSLKFKVETRIALNDDLLEICDDMLLLSTELQEPYYILVSHLHYSAYFITTDRYEDAFPHLQAAEELWKENREEITSKYNLSQICYIYNDLALYYINHSLDHKRGIEYFVEGAEFAKSHNLEKEYALIAYNWSILNFMRDDSSGLEFAQTVYDQGNKWENSNIKFLGSLGLAMMYYISAEYDQALKYIDIALEMNPNSKRYGVNLYVTYADILYSFKDYQRAEENYIKSLERIDNNTSIIHIDYIYLSYGKFCLEQNRPEEAIELLHKATNIEKEGATRPFLYRIYNNLSLAYSKIGNWEKSLEYHRKYHDEYRKVFDVQNEKEFNELSRKYQAVAHTAEVQGYKLEVQKVELESERKSRQLLLVIIVAVGAFIVALLSYMMYKNENKLYTKIAKQYKVAEKKEKEFRRRIQEQQSIIDDYLAKQHKTPNPVSVSYADKNKELFMSIEEQMQVNKVYREQDLGREKLAKYMNTNHDYITKAINENTSKSVTQYINSYRIEEAIKLLSDVSNDLPLKAIHAEIGFVSIATFYRLFKEEVGMSPAKYRAKISQIS